jgi:hypothetical protein
MSVRGGGTGGGDGAGTACRAQDAPWTLGMTGETTGGHVDDAGR